MCVRTCFSPTRSPIRGPWLAVLRGRAVSLTLVLVFSIGVPLLVLRRMTRVHAEKRDRLVHQVSLELGVSRNVAMYTLRDLVDNQAY